MPDIELIFPPEEENIELLIPTTTPEINVGDTISFDNITGTLPLSRTTGKLDSDRLDGIMTASEAHGIWHNA
jgi:hypothetical protein